jgi:hypothetical protein
MGLFSKAPEQKASAQRYTDAMDELERVPRNATDEEFNRANDAVHEAMEDPNLSAWARWWG